MAGESPDRSKRYESSTGSTPGRGSTRASEEAAAQGTDQATAVFSRRDLTETETESGGASRNGGSSEAADSPEAPETPEAPEAPETPKSSKAPEVSETSEGEDEGAGSDSRSSADADAADESGSEPEAPKAEAEARPESDTKSDAKSDEGADSDSDSDSDSGSDASPDDDADSDTDADATTDKAPERPVDQPTAIFKSPHTPRVDQPTTMLKLGDKPPAAEPETGKPETGKPETGKDEPKPDAPKPAKPETATPKPPEPKPDAPKPDAPTPERDPERTSKFVALKSLDEPVPVKPRPAPPASATSTGAPAAAPAEATAAVPQIGPERTTQQPLPPKPPLDLLAELTNTPPPPPTPMRTLARRVKIWTPLVILLVIVFAVVQSLRPLPAPTLDLTAEDTFTFEGGKPEIPWPSSGQAALDVQGIGTFGSSGDQKPVPIASVAKVMTAYLILRDHPVKSGADGPMIKIDQRAEDESDAGDESTVNVTAGDSISQREAIESILIASANNVARLLARWDAGSDEAFVEKMNKAAEDLGMTNTTYTDPSGLNNTTVSTAVDQVKLAKEAMKQPVFREVAAMMSYDDYKGVNHSNWNQLVGSNNVVGIKTGTTTSALGNLTFAAKKDVDGETRTIVGAVVRQPAGGPDNTILGAALYEGDQLIRAAQGALESATILKKGDVVGHVDDGLGGRTPVVATEDVQAVGWAGLKVELTFAAGDLPHTAKAGTEVGTLAVGDGTSSAVKVPVALKDDLLEPGFMDKVTRLG